MNSGRLEEKIDKLDERMDRMEVHMERNNTLLEVHIKRNDNFEIALKPVLEHISFLQSLKRLLTWVAGIASGLGALWAILSKVFGGH